MIQHGYGCCAATWGSLGRHAPGCRAPGAGVAGVPTKLKTSAQGKESANAGHGGESLCDVGLLWEAIPNLVGRIVLTDLASSIMFAGGSEVLMARRGAHDGARLSKLFVDINPLCRNASGSRGDASIRSGLPSLVTLTLGEAWAP